MATFRRFTRTVADTTFERSGRFKFKNIFHVLIQKEVPGERINLASNQEGDNQAVEDYFEYPPGGASSIPFDLDLWTAKANAGDGNKFVISVMFANRPGEGVKGVDGV